MESVVRQDISDIISENPELIDQFIDRATLVTGATGMIGRYAVCLLAESIRERNGSGKVIANVRNRAKGEKVFAEYLSDDSFSLLVSDVNDVTEIEGSLDYIVHSASPTQPNDFLEHPVDIIKTNVFATDTLLRIAKDKSARFCLLSTLEVYGAVHSPTYPAYVAEEDFGSLDSLHLRSAYPESKRLAEALCVAYKKQFSVDSTIVRLAPTISPVIDPADERVFAQFINTIVKKEDITIFADAADKQRSYTYIADAITGIFTAMARSTDEMFVFNLANNDNVASIKELAEAVISVAGEGTAKLNIAQREVNQNTSASTGLLLLDSKRLLDTGWVPRYSLEKSMEQAVRHVSSLDKS